MKILFFMRHAGYVRNFEPLLRELLARDHELGVLFDIPDAEWHHGLAVLDTLRIDHSAAPRREEGAALLARAIRYQLDYLRFLGPEYADAPRLRERAARRVPLPVRMAFARPRSRRFLRAVLERLERSIPIQPALPGLLEEARPDVVALTPLVSFGSEQVDYVRVARGLGIPSVLLVAGWDNLTNKARLREIPDRVVVWNEAQAEEATQLHGVDRAAVVVAGAHSYDHWFGWRPRRQRDEHCAEVGVRADVPYLLYVCSSSFIAPDEVSFVKRWVRALRASADLADTGVVVRPHPQNAEQWAGVDLTELGNAAVWPPGGADPVDEPRRADYFDSIHHAAAVVGMNTSALVESAIVGTPALTVLADEFRGTQEGTLHFRMIAGSNGAVRVAHGLPEHLDQLRDALAERPDQSPAADFISWFVRPHGLDRPAAPLAADALEEAAALTPTRTSEPRPVPLLGAALALVARAGPPLHRTIRRLTRVVRKPLDGEGRG